MCYCSWLISVWKQRLLFVFRIRKWHRSCSFSIIMLKKVPKIQFSAMQKTKTPLQWSPTDISKFLITSFFNPVLIQVPLHPTMTTTSKEIFFSDRFKTTFLKISCPIAQVYYILQTYFEPRSCIIGISPFWQYLPN